MRKLKTIGLILSLGLSGLSYGQNYLRMIDEGGHTFSEIKKEAEAYFDQVGRGKGTGYKQFQRWEYTASRSLNDNGYVENGNNSIKERQAFRNSYASKGTTTTGTWSALGPDNLTITNSWSSWIGRLTSIAVDPNNYNHIIVTGPTGGVWKTTDGGSNWTSLFDDMSSMDVYASAIDPANSNNYFVGVTGEGILYSTDAGLTWSSASGSGTAEINKIVIDPTNSNNMLLSKTYYGVYRSTDAGRSWTTVSSMTDDCYDIEYKPGDPNTVYASGAGVIKKSTDGGANFSTISGPWSTSTADVLMMAVTADNPDALWAVQESGSSFAGLYKSSNGGTSFSTVNFSITGLTGDNLLGYDPDETGGQAPRDMDIVISPDDENEVHVAGITTYRTTNGGTSFTRTTDWTHGNSYGFIHADCDAMYYVGNTIYFATDGGIFKSTDEASTFTDLTPGINTHQLYKIGISQTTDGLVTGGSQDNGACLRDASGNWTAWLGADGMETFIDKNNDDILIGTTQNGWLYKSTNGGQSAYGINPSGNPDGNWVTPFEQDPTTAGTYYVGYDQLYKSTNRGDDWTGISITGASGNMDELKIAPSNNQVIYCSFGSDLFKTTNGGTSWTDVSPSVGSSINYISIDPNDPNRVALATSSSSNRVLLSTDGGVSWTNAMDNLPNLTTYCVLLDGESDNGLYVGVNGGIYYTNDGLANYVEFSQDLPNVRVYELEIQSNSDKIYAGTYGRGLWVSDVYAEANFTNDAEISGLQGLWSNGEHCGTTLTGVTVDVKNKGQNNITAYTVTIYNGTTLLETINNNTNLSFNQSETVNVPDITVSGGTVDLKAVVSISSTDENSANDEVSTSFTVTSGNYAQLNLTFDSWSTETGWSVTGTGGVIQSINEGDYPRDQTPLSYTFCLEDGCFDFEISDEYGDGLDDGTTQGTYEIVDFNGGNLVSMGAANFGFDTTHSFCVPEVTVNFSADETTIDNCEEITFTASTTGPVTSYDWDFDDGVIIVSGANSASVTVYYSTTGNKSVSLSVDGGISESKIDYISVSQDANITPTISIALTNGSNPACIGDELTFGANTEHEGDAPTYDWFVNGNSQSINSNTFAYFPNNGDAVTAELTSNKECRSEDDAASNSISVVVNSCTGIAESMLGTAVNIHPNPTTDVVTISVDNKINGQTIKVFNNVGQVLFFDNNLTSGYARQLDMSTFPIGTYYVHITSGEHSIVRKLIKE